MQKKLRKINYVLFHLRKYFKTSNLLKIYKVIFEPVLTYSIINWGKAPSYFLEHIKILQKNAIRACIGLPFRASVSSKSSELNIYPMPVLYQFYLGSFVFKYKNEFDITELVRSSRIGKKMGAFIPNWTHYRSRIQAAYTGAKWYNQVELEVSDYLNSASFKRSFKELLKGKLSSI